MATLAEELTKHHLPEDVVNRIVTYINNAKREEAKKEANKRPVTNNSADQLYGLIMKWWAQGLAVDGVNVVITGNNMAMVTFNGYKNKVLATYPETQFDIQLVREGDEFKVSKESGSVVYTHNIADPFESTEHQIIGAYCIFKNKRGEYLETLNQTDYEKMKSASKQAYLWGQWESEFWLKSVIKRACKRHFYDVVEEIDKMDNDDYGVLADKQPAPKTDDPKVVELAIETINAATTAQEATDFYKHSGLMANAKITLAYKKRLESLTQHTDTTDEDS